MSVLISAKVGDLFEQVRLYFVYYLKVISILTNKNFLKLYFYPN